MYRQLVMIRHGESVWNRENLFTGWTDVDLSETGREEARQGGTLLKEAGSILTCATHPTSGAPSTRQTVCWSRWTRNGYLW